MAHPVEVKAKALAMLLMKERVTVVSKELGIPKSTISRWKVEADRLFRRIFESSPKLRAMASEIRKTFSELHCLYKTGLKKGFTQ